MEPKFSEEEMKRNYPHFRAFVFAKLKEEFSQSLEPLAGDDLQKIIEQEGAVPLSSFIREIENPVP
jgi:hypothetical protein